METAQPHVFVTRQLSEEVVAEFHDSLGARLRVHPGTQPPNRQELLAGASGAAALVTMVTDRIDPEVLDTAGAQLKIVANVAVGYDNIDIRGAVERGVIVTNTPGVLDEATADLTMALLLSTVRRVTEADRFIRTGEPWIWGPQDFVGLDVSAGATLGIVGLGRIGMALARRAHAFGMKIVATGRRAHSEEARKLGIMAAELDQLLERSDIVSLHCPLTEDNHHMIAKDQLAAMKPGGYLINTARGPLVDEDALADALESGHLAGAGLDVHEHEPQVNQRLAGLAPVVLLPHIGSAGEATRYEMARSALSNVAHVLSGEEPLNPVS